MTPPINKPKLDTSPAGVQDPFGSKTTKTKKQKHQSTMPPCLTKKCHHSRHRTQLHLAPHCLWDALRSRTRPHPPSAVCWKTSRVRSLTQGKDRFSGCGEGVDPRPGLRRLPGLQGRANLEAEHGFWPHPSGQGRRQSTEVCHGCPPGCPVS
jgi:hypothetical protein